MGKEKVKKPFYKKWWVWLIAIIIVFAATNGEDATEPAKETAADAQGSGNNDKQEKPKEDKKHVAGIGEAATVADVSFTINKVEETKEIKQEYGDPVTTDGKFVIAEATIKNDQKESLTIDSSFFKIKANGSEYEPATDGEVIMAMSMNGEKDFFLQQVNPGLSKTGKVVFEVPADVNVKDAVIHCQTGFFGTETIEINLK